MEGFRIVSTDEVQRGLDRDSGLHLLNVQTGRSFTGELIPGSRRLPVDRIGAQSFAVSKDAEIVTYCGGPKCSHGEEAARKLVALGYTNVAVYKEGLEGWKAAGNEIVASQPLPVHAHLSAPAVPGYWTERAARGTTQQTFKKLARRDSNAGPPGLEAPLSPGALSD